MTIHFAPGELDMSNVKQDLLAPPSGTPIEPAEILKRSRILHMSEDKTIWFGDWECEPGSSRWEFTNRQEIILVTSGSMTVQEDGGEPVKLTAGCRAVFPLGWRGTWTVHETLRKEYSAHWQSVGASEAQARQMGLRPTSI